MITVMGATGNTGKKITESLLKAGEKVRALGRSESKLAALKRAGAEVAAQKAYIMKVDKEGGPAVGLSALMAPLPQLTDAQRGAIADYIITSFKPKAPAK